jgi:AcrR family transcriptional regulator
MGIAERREREREEVRRKILDAARELFTTEGYDRVTMRRIADAIEYSPTTIYLHFEDKDDLVKSLCEEDLAQLLGALQEGGLPADPIERIKRLGVAYATFGRSYPNHYRFMFMTSHHLDEPSDAGDQSFDLLRSAVQEAIASGQFRPIDPDTASQVLWASIHGAVALLVTYAAEKFPCIPAVSDLVPQVIENGVRGLLAAPQAGER